jgi:AbrB family looped-hinge helix DNA binding protein
MKTLVTHKGQTTIPLAIRQRFGIQDGTAIEWSVDKKGIHAKPIKEKLNEAQKFVLKHAGKGPAGWSKGLLERTRRHDLD